MKIANYSADGLHGVPAFVSQSAGPKSRSRRPAFTLIELLVVIAILGNPVDWGWLLSHTSTNP